MTAYGLAQYLVSFLTVAGIYALLCLALNIQWGFGGLFNAGIAGFFAMGAYASAILTAPAAVASGRFGGLGLPIPVGLAAAAVIAGATGWAVARICIRLKSDYLAMASIGIAEILRLGIVNEQWLTNGSLGIANIPRPFGASVTGDASAWLFAAIVWALVGLCWLVCARLYDSPWGRALRAIRDNEDAARAVGKDVEALRLQTYVIGCALMGVAGALSAHYFRFLSPAATDTVLVTFLVWVMLIVGGSGNNTGAVLGALAIWGIWSMTEIATARLPADWVARSSYLRMFLVGLLLQVVLQRYRGGLAPERSPPLRADLTAPDTNRPPAV